MCEILCWQILFFVPLPSTLNTQTRLGAECSTSGVEISTTEPMEIALRALIEWKSLANPVKPFPGIYQASAKFSDLVTSQRKNVNGTLNSRSHRLRLSDYKVLPLISLSLTPDTVSGERQAGFLLQTQIKKLLLRIINHRGSNFSFVENRLAEIAIFSRT